MNIELLRKINEAQASNTPFYVSQAEGLPLVQNNPQLITVDTSKVDPTDNTKIAATLTADGTKALSDAASKPAASSAGATALNVQIGTGGFVRPKTKRGGGRGIGVAKYPFEQLEIGQYFFIADSEVSKNDAFKTLGSAVGSANQRYSEGTGEFETVKRAKRGNDHKTVKNADGSNVTEEVSVEKRKSLRKFVVSKVESGKTYGSFTASANGAVVMRTNLN